MPYLTHCCPLCASTDLEMKHAAHIVAFVEHRMTGRLEPDINKHLAEPAAGLICQSCQLQFSDRRYTPQEERRYYHGYAELPYIRHRQAYEPTHAAWLEHHFLREQKQRNPIRQQELRGFFIRHLGTNGLTYPRVLDFGGQAASVVNVFTEDSLIMATDVNDLALAAGAKPWDGRPVDLVVCQQVLEHVSNVRTVVEILLKAARPGGWIYLEVPDEQPYWGQPMIHEHINGWSLPPLNYIAKEWALTLVASELYAGNYCLLAKTAEKSS